MTKTGRTLLAAAVAAGSLSMVKHAFARVPAFQSYNTQRNGWGSSTNITRVTSGGGQLHYTNSTNYLTQTPAPNGGPDAIGGVFTDAGFYVEASPSVAKSDVGTYALTGSGTNDTAYVGDYFQSFDLYVDLARWTAATTSIPLFWVDQEPRGTDGNFIGFQLDEHNFRYYRPNAAQETAGGRPVTGGVYVGIDSFDNGANNGLGFWDITSNGWYTFVETFRKATTASTDGKLHIENDFYVIDSTGNLLARVDPNSGSHSYATTGGAFQVTSTYDNAAGLSFAGQSGLASTLGGGGYQWVGAFWQDANTTQSALGNILAMDNNRSDLGKLQGVPVPEPSTLGLLALGGVAALRRRKATA